MEDVARLVAGGDGIELVDVGRDAEAELGALVGQWRRPDPAAHRRDELATDEQADAGARGGRRLRGRPVVQAEQPLGIVQIDARPVVTHPHEHLALAVLEADLDGRAGSAVLGRVGQQVAHDLGEVLLVRGDHLHRPARAHLDGDLGPQHLLPLHELPDDPVEQDRADAAELAATLDARHGHEVLDHPLQPFGLCGDADEELIPRLGIEASAAPEQQLGAAVDRGHRRAQLVRQDAEEPVADLVRLVAPGDVRDDRDLEGPPVELERTPRDLGGEVGAVDPAPRRLGAEHRAIAGGGGHLVLVHRHDVGQVEADEPVDGPAEKLAGLARRPGDAALLVEGENGVGVGLEQGPEACLVGAHRARLLGLTACLAQADEHLLAVDRVRGQGAEVGQQGKVVADEERPALDVRDETLRLIAAGADRELDG